MGRYTVNIEHDTGSDLPLSPLNIPKKPPRGTRVKFTDNAKSQRLRGRVAYVAEHNQYGMFWVWVPAIAEADAAYAKHLFGPFMKSDIGKGKIMELAPSRARAPDLDRIFAPRFKRGRRS